MALNFGKLNFSTSFSPTAAFPLDSRSYFESLALAQAAAATAEEAGSSNTVYHFGETIAVFENHVATLYIIKAVYDDDLEKYVGELEEVGSKTLGDDRTIELDGGVLSLREFGKHYYQYIAEHEDEETHEIVPAHYEKVSGFKAGLQPQAAVDPSDSSKFVLEWYEPNPTTVEGLSARITAVEGRATNLETNKQDNLTAVNGLKLDANNNIGIDLDELFILDGSAEDWEDNE